MRSTYFEIFIEAFGSLPEDARVLDDEKVFCPPVEDYGYVNTPRNALTFCAMGVDGVHQAILKLEKGVQDNSPVVYVSPTDADDVNVLAESFLQYLAIGCGVLEKDIDAVFEAGPQGLADYLTTRFQTMRLLSDEARLKDLTRRYGHLIERKEQ